MLLSNFVSNLHVMLLLLRLGSDMKSARITSDGKDGVQNMHSNKQKFRVSQLVFITENHSTEVVERYLEKMRKQETLISDIMLNQKEQYDLWIYQLESSSYK